MRSLVVGVLLAATMAACGSPSGTVFSATLRNLDGEYPLPVSLRDETGLVVGIGGTQVDSGAFRDAGILADPAGPNAFVLTWLGGMCDSDAELVFRANDPSSDAGYDLHVAIHGKVGFGGCPSAGLLRAVRFGTRDPLDLASIAISGNKSIELVTEEDCGALQAAATGDAKVACLAMLTATVGEALGFASVTVVPEDGACPGTECSTAAGIEAQAWLVDATDRSGGHWAWRCTYRSERATCTVLTQPEPT